MSFQLDLYQELSSQFFFVCVCLHVLNIALNDISDMTMSFVYQTHIYVYVFFYLLMQLLGILREISPVKQDTWPTLIPMPTLGR